ncbi:MAG: hypothetical protein ACOX6V_04425 [Patescibacteria group bacterium]|jgi:F-type H+-transporting ATPase subunit alpha
MQSYEDYLKTSNEYGLVANITHPIAVVDGLPGATPGELVVFESGEVGQILSLHNKQIEVLLFSRKPVRVGSKLTRTDTRLSVPVGEKLLGMTINPLGETLTNGKTPPFFKEQRDIDIVPPKITQRQRITSSFLTGVGVIDLLLPLGKGQRELVVGDRKTGKTSFLLTTILKQVQEGTIVVYAAIGKQLSDIKKLKTFFEKEKVSESIVLVAASTNESPSLIYLTPFTAMTIAEYFRDQGRDVAVIFDDLSTHAKFYRQIALIAKRFPGRESYPGDVFYTHARLLERAGNFTHPQKGEVAITCLPIAETVEANLTNYIVSNLISITDGHILFDFSIFSQGRRPAVNVPLSVTRVGKQTQDSVRRDLTRTLLAFLTQYERAKSFTHFGTELTDEIKSMLKRGKELSQILDQPTTQVIPITIAVIFAAMIWKGMLTEFDEATIDKLMSTLIAKYEKDEKTKKFLDNLVDKENVKQSLLLLEQKREEVIALCQPNKN